MLIAVRLRWCVCMCVVVLASSIAELHERLKAKLEMLRASREPKQRPEHIAAARAKRKSDLRAKKVKVWLLPFQNVNPLSVV